MSTESVMLSNRLILCLPLLLLPSILASIRVLSSELALCITWPWYWSFSISPSDEYSGQTLPPKFIFPSSALPQTFIRISVELSVSFCNVCIFCPHWVWLVLFLRTSTMIHWPLCPISLQIYSAPSVVLEPAGCLIDIFQISTPVNKACSF